MLVAPHRDGIRYKVLEEIRGKFVAPAFPCPPRAGGKPHYRGFGTLVVLGGFVDRLPNHERVVDCKFSVSNAAAIGKRGVKRQGIFDDAAHLVGHHHDGNCFPKTDILTRPNDFNGDNDRVG
ncbi:MAG: hypothetical protein M3O46_13430 [Myxococcota bacterium]|nr:hypothetical protein [Myxococcota bacterium]